MKFSEIANRLTGISTPFVVASWQPVEMEIAAARRVIAFLEDRRVETSRRPGYFRRIAAQAARALTTEATAEINAKSQRRDSRLARSASMTRCSSS